MSDPYAFAVTCCNADGLVTSTKDLRDGAWKRYWRAGGEIVFDYASVNV